MKCEDCRLHMPDFWEGALDDEQTAAVEMHVASCPLCRTEAERLGTIWRTLGQIPADEPSREMRTRFYERLDAYQQGFAEAKLRSPKSSLLSAVRGWWVASPAFQAGFSVAMLVLGLAGGFLIDSRRDGGQVAQDSEAR